MVIKIIIKKYSKTKPILPEEFDEIKKWWSKREVNENAWKVSINDIIIFEKGGKLQNVKLDLKNPNRKNDFEYHDPIELTKSIINKEIQVMRLIKEIQSIVLTTEISEASI